MSDHHFSFSDSRSARLASSLPNKSRGVARINGRQVASIFFDLDGTLTDPKEGITRSIAYALQKIGVEPPPPERLTWCIGPPLLESLRVLAGDGTTAEEALRHYRERFSEVGLFENRLYDGVLPGLAALSSSPGARLFVATSKPKVFAERILSHFGLDPFFETLFAAELDGTRSDKSHLLDYALARSGSDASAAVMVGDRRHDVRGALNNGIRAIGITYGYGTREELAEAGARTIYDSPNALFEGLRRCVFGDSA